jgi:hypothetical protein
MKKTVITIVLVISLISFSNLFAAEIYETFILPSNYLKLSFDYNINSNPLSLHGDLDKSKDILEPNGNGSFSSENYPQKQKDSITQFNLAAINPAIFSLKIPSEIISIQRNKKSYSGAAFEITSLNVTVWFFNKFIDHQPWANISLDSMLKNLRSGFAYDIDTYRTNKFGHPYHGAIHYSIGRANGLNFLESTISSTFGSYTWEVFLESIRPSSNDLILNTLGGVALGEVLFKIGDLLLDENSSGFERIFRKSLAFILNPAYAIKALSGQSFGAGNPQHKHFYDLSIPFGAYAASNDKPRFLIAANLEYKDFLKKDFSRISPYDWFSLDFRLGIHENHILHREIFTAGIIAGKRIKNGLAGLFGVFDYIESDFAGRFSAVGLGPGLVTIYVNDSNLFFNSSGILSLIYGGSSPSIDSDNAHFGMKVNDPYYSGPGMLGKVKLEFGKKDFGSIETAFSQYWVHSIYTDADEFLTILSLNIKYDLSAKSQISLGYDYYLRHASLQERYFTGAKPAIRALYIYKF